MPEIRVRPVAVEGAAAALAVGAQEVRAARDALAEAAGAAGATGSAAAASSYTRMHTTWMQALDTLGDLMGALGQASADAAGAYTTTDRSAFGQPPAAPGTPSGPSAGTAGGQP